SYALSLTSFPTRRSSDLVDREPRARPVDPGEQVPWTLVCELRPPKAHERLLRHVVCLGEIPQHASTLLPNEREVAAIGCFDVVRSEEHTSELQSRFDLVC